MKKILNKTLAMLIIMLMVFGVSANLISHAVDYPAHLEPNSISIVDKDGNSAGFPTATLDVSHVSGLNDYFIGEIIYRDCDIYDYYIWIEPNSVLSYKYLGSTYFFRSDDDNVLYGGFYFNYDNIDKYPSESVVRYRIEARAEGTRTVIDTIDGYIRLTGEIEEDVDIKLKFYNIDQNNQSTEVTDSGSGYKFNTTATLTVDNKNDNYTYSIAGQQYITGVSVNELSNGNWRITTNSNTQNTSYNLTINATNSSGKKVGTKTITIIPLSEETGNMRIMYTWRGENESKSGEAEKGSQITIDNDYIYLMILGLTGTHKDIIINGSEHVASAATGTTGIYKVSSLSNGTNTLKFEGNEDTLLIINANSAAVVGESSGCGSSHTASSGVTIRPDRGAPSTSDTMGGTPNWILKDGNGIQYLCYNHGLHLNYKEGNAYYKVKKMTGSVKQGTIKDQLILAWITYASDEEAASIAGQTLSSTWREHLKQYYVWNHMQAGTETASYGTALGKIIETLENEQNGYINTTNQTLKYDGKTHKITNFQVDGYYLSAKYNQDGTLIWDQDENDPNDFQPLITITVEVDEGEGITIQLQKRDETGRNILSGAEIFIWGVEEKNGSRTGMASYQKTIGEEGYINISLNPELVYYIFETKAPEGYEACKEILKFELNEDGSLKEQKIYKAAEEDIDRETGAIKAKDQGLTIEEANLVETSKQWIIGNGNETIKQVFQLRDKEKSDSPKITIRKVDEAGNPLPGVTMTYIVSGENVNDLTEDVTLDDEDAELILEGLEALEEYNKIVIYEKETVEGYELSDEFASFIKNEEGKFELEGIYKGTRDGEGYLTEEDKLEILEEDSDWKIIDRENLVFELTNKTVETNKGLKIYKIDNVNKAPMRWVRFTYVRKDNATGSFYGPYNQNTSYTEGSLVVELLPNQEYYLYEQRASQMPYREYEATLEYMHFITDQNSNITFYEILKGNEKDRYGYLDVGSRNAEEIFNNLSRNNVVGKEGEDWQIKSNSDGLLEYYVINKSIYELETIAIKINKIDAETKESITGTTAFDIGNKYDSRKIIRIYGTNNCSKWAVKFTIYKFSKRWRFSQL